MTANMVGIGELLGPGVSSQSAAASEGMVNGEGETAFAQLLDGLGVTPPAAVAAGVIAPALAKAARAVADTSAEAATTPEEMLALCGIPMASQPVPVPPVIAARQNSDMPRVTIEQSLPGVPATYATRPSIDSASQPSTTSPSDAGSTSTLTSADIQWLHSKSATSSDRQMPMAAAQAQPQLTQTQLTQSQFTQSQQALAPQLPQVDARQTQDIEIPNGMVDSLNQAANNDFSAVPQGKRDASDDQQTLLQTVTTQVMQAEQTTPIAAAVNAQFAVSSKDERTEVSSPAVTDLSGVISGALSSAQLQTAGTQLADDAHALSLIPRHHLHAQVGTHEWATELGNKLTMMATKDTQSATLYMTPADLGPVQVRIEMNQDQASVWFTAEHADTRSALEQSLPRLRELFAAQGMSLTDAGVFGDRSRQQQPESQPNNHSFGMQYLSDDDLADTATVRSISLGMLDAYA